MQNNYSILQPSSNALPFNGDCDKPFGLGFNFIMANRYTENSLLCNKCGLSPKYPAQGLCKKCYFEKQQAKFLSQRIAKIVDNLQGEVWAKIQDAEGYEISNMGRVKNTNSWCRIMTNKSNEKIIKLREARKGSYLKVDLDKYNWRPSVHRLVAIYFVPNPNNLPQVLHKDNNKQNNIHTNLYWGTISRNRRDYIEHTDSIGLIRKKMPKEQVLDIYKSILSTQELSIKYEIQPSTVWIIKTGYRWSKITGHKNTDKRYAKN